MIKIYREISTGVYTEYSQYGSSEDSPITTTHDGVLGESRELKLFIRSDNVDEYYTNITVDSVSLVTPDDTLGTTTGWGVKLRAGLLQPTESEWDAIDYGVSISFDDIGSAVSGDINTYLPFWYRVEVPAGASAQNKETIVLELSYTANAV